MSRNVADERSLIAAVDAFAQKMKAKLLKKARQGYEGWDEDGAHHLAGLLYEHLEKGDPVDIANFCMMLERKGKGFQLSITHGPCDLPKKPERHRTRFPRLNPSLVDERR